MKKSNLLWIFLAFLCCTPSSLLFAQNEFEVTSQTVRTANESTYAQQPPAPRTPTVQELLQGRINDANRVMNRGQYEKAGVLYEQLLRDPDLTRRQREQVQARYEKITYNLLFSSKDSPYSTTYTVVSGDNLYDIAKEHKTTVGLIKKMNNLEKDMIYPDQKLRVLKGTLSIFVDKSENKLTLRLDDKILKRYSVATGKENKTPVGDFKIVSKLEDPIWYKTGAVVESGSDDNELGTRWLGFDYPGYGIHGTTDPGSIGTQATAGCVRMLNREVEELFSFVPRGTKVTVVD